MSDRKERNPQRFPEPRRLLPLATLLGLCLTSGLVVGCSSNPRPGTGDLAFRLSWSGVSDMDLFVVDPAGDCIFYGDRSAESGGRLDIDCNRGTDFLCEKPLENVFWPKRGAPVGTFLFWVEAHALIPAEAPLSFELLLLKGKSIVWRHQGIATHHEQIEGPFSVGFPGDPTSFPTPLQGPPPNCSTTFYQLIDGAIVPPPGVPVPGAPLPVVPSQPPREQG
ncbi:MAG: hypothetical protein K0U98_00670 [Deltaproteobacteria bacterium]|nr:hypothetical protein [Deltaproteobacteria bacterium]